MLVHLERMSNSERQRELFILAERYSNQSCRTFPWTRSTNCLTNLCQAHLKASGTHIYICKDAFIQSKQWCRRQQKEASNLYNTPILPSRIPGLTGHPTRAARLGQGPGCSLNSSQHPACSLSACRYHTVCCCDTEMNNCSDRFETFWDIASTADFITERKYTVVTLQFPDELLKDATLVQAALADECTSRGIKIEAGPLPR